ncbi:MAG: phosphatase PAP2 family protein [Alphaproteobacteria bacterium]|nr:phosphatase PAP2 family protein [Alphaproteobacteria bacterium]MDD9919692.1 phosphatase PAP2 family protein [Alphaproteobacteria bacterium]
MAGLLLWFSGIDIQITLFFESMDTPWGNAFWRVVGQAGLGRWQLILCLGIAWFLVRPSKRLSWLDAKILARLFIGATYIWLRLLVLNTKPVQRSKYFWQRAAKYCQQLQWEARVWLYAMPIMFGAGVLCTLLKVLIGRPRPKMMLWHDTITAIGPTLSAKFHSFPSGHTTTTFALLAVLHTAFPRYRWVWWPVACLTAFARVGAITPHFMGDVAAGAAIGYGVGIYLINKYKLSRL